MEVPIHTFAGYNRKVLRKGQSVPLSKQTGPKRVMLGFGRDVNPDKGFIEIDAAAFMLDVSGKVRNSKDLVFYGAAEHESGAVVGFNCLESVYCDGDVDDEVYVVDIPKIPAEIQKIVFTITIYDKYGELSFADVESVYVRLVNISKAPAKELRGAIDGLRGELVKGYENGPVRAYLCSLLYSADNKNIARFDLTNVSDGAASLEIAELVRKGDDWDFVALGNGVKGDLADLCKKYGVKVN
jgi:tellurium resistance protein TerD